MKTEEQEKKEIIKELMKEAGIKPKFKEKVHVEAEAFREENPEVKEMIDVYEKNHKYGEFNNIEVNEGNYSELQKEVITALLLKKRDGATEMIVEEIKKTNYIYTTRNDNKSEVWIYDNGIYKPEGKTFIKEHCRGILGKAYTPHLSNEIISKIEADTYIDEKEFFTINDIDEIPVQNGILNLKTRELSEFDPKKIFFNKLPMPYNPEAKCPAINAHFKGVLESKEDITRIEEVFGEALLKEYRIEKAIFFLGFGRNGKGKTLELMKRFVGADNCSAVALKNMREDNFHIFNMFGKLVNLSGDLSDTSLKETGCLKQLIGRDIISGDRKNKSMINFINYSTIMFGGNDLPKVYDTTDGFWDKWEIFNFPFKFITQKEINSLPEKERKNKRVIDPDHANKISSIEELSGLLNLALDGLDRLTKNNQYSYSKTGKEIKEFWIRKSDSFAAFCMDCIEADYDGYVSKKELRNKYSKYCKYLRLKGSSDVAIKITLNNEFGCIDNRKYYELERRQERIWEGIKFKENIDDLLRDLSISQGSHSFCSSLGDKSSYVSGKTPTSLSNEDNSLVNNSESQFSDEDIEKSGINPDLIKKIEKEVQNGK